MLLGLRMMCGIKYTKEMQGCYNEVLKELEEKELLYIQDRQIYLTEKGIDVSNYVFTHFIS